MRPVTAKRPGVFMWDRSRVKGTIVPITRTDAVHIAITTLNGLDFIVSLNFTHIARLWTIEKVRQVNAREKYKGIGIYKPAEVLEIYEDSSRLHE